MVLLHIGILVYCCCTNGGFYNNRKQKRVPNNISDLLTPLSLAIWICDKGVYYKSGITIHTSSFTKEEVLLLLFPRFRK